MGVATSLSRVAPQRDLSSESLRRGGRSSCLHVHVPLARVARGSDPCLQQTLSPAAPRTTTTTHTHNNLLPPSLSSFQKAPHSSAPNLPPYISQASHLTRPRKTHSQSFLHAVRPPRLRSLSHAVSQPRLAIRLFLCRVATGPRFLLSLLLHPAPFRERGS